MKYLISLFLGCILLIQCAKPLADFASETAEDYNVPARIILKNKSQNASEYRWTLNGEDISSSADLDYYITESGRYQLELTASNGSKEAHIAKEIFVSPSENCTFIMHTSEGDMVFALREETIGHLTNFVHLIESGFYKGLLFHRVIDGFMIQGGDNKTRTGGKRYDEPDPIPHEIDVSMPHFRGALAAARMPDDINPDKNSSGSQFYIVDGREYTEEKILKVQANKISDYSKDEISTYVAKGGSPQLDGEYTVFGYMISGFEVLDKIASVPTDKYDKPVDGVKIIDVRFLN